jgi:hypothetical protein
MGRWSVEGINMAAIMLGYLGVLLFALASVVALGLLIARKTTAARILFASGLLTAVTLLVVATVWYVWPDFTQGRIESVTMLFGSCLLLAGAGQFMAALRGPKVYAAALACAVFSVLAWLLLGGGDYLAPLRVGSSHLGGFALTSAAILSATASLLIPVFSNRRA